MRKTYRDKREFYKAKKEEAEEKLRVASQELERMKEEEWKRKEGLKKRWNATVYCENCQHVSDVSIPPDVKLTEGDCIVCRVRGMLKLVRHYPGKV